MILNKTNEKKEHIENLAFANWQYQANEKAYEFKMITTASYEYAKEKLQIKIDNLSEICYS